MASKMTRAEKERRQAAKQNEKAKKKEEAKKGKSNSSSSLNLPKLFDEPKEKKSFAQRFAEDTKKLDIGNKREERAAAKEKKTRVSDRSWRNPMTKTGVSMPDNIDVTRGNSGRTREEMERRTSQRELSQMAPDKWMKTSRETVGLKDNEKAGVGLGTIQHGTLNKNAELFSSNWDRIPQGSRVDAAIQIIYTYGINDQNRDMVMSAFDGASTYDKRKIMDAAVQTVGWNDVTYGMKQAVNNAPDAKEALMQQISEDMNVRNGNYLDTFKREASKAVVDQYNLQQKEDKIITDWAKENYDLGEAIKMATLEKGGSLVNGLTDSVAFGVSDLLQIGQQDNVLDGVNPFEGVKNTEGFGNKIARVGTNVLHDLFRLTGINVSLFSKAFLNEREVREITDALNGITDPYYEAVRNNMVALEGSNLSESQKTAVEIYGAVVEQIPSIVMAVVASPAAGLATTGVTAGGKYARSAYEQGATLEEAVRFGLAGAATEVATEKMFTGFGYFGKGAASKVLNETTKKMLQQSAFPNSMSARILKRVVAGGGEASEEMIAELVQPFLERSTYDPAADNATLEEVLRSGGIGFAVAQILGLPANALGVTADVLQAYDTKAQERVINDNLRKMVTEGLENGRIDEATAANINAQVSDIRKGKGVLTQSEAKEETKVTGENLDKVYSDFAEAREAMKAEAKGMKNGETVRARFMQDGEVKTWESKVANGGITTVQQGITTNAEKVAYAEKAKRVASATNTAERTGYQLNVKDEIVKEVSALSKAFNREVEFYYDKNSAVHGNVDLNTGKIYVNVNSSQSPAAAVIAHEMTHLLENTSSYKTLTNMMQKYYASSLEDKRNEIIAIYKSNPKAMKTILDENDKIKMDVIDSEVMAAFIEEKLLTDYNTIRELTRTDRTLAQKIVDWINKVIQKITGSREQRFLIEARDVWSKALKEEKGNKKAPVDGADKRYSYGGEHAKTADLDALKTAKSMLAENNSAADIFRETGWFVGTDGKWRFEIDDSGMVYSEKGKQGNPDQERQKELYNKMFSGTITQKEWDELAILEKNGVRKQRLLEDYIDHQALFDAYPQLRKINLEFSAEDLGRSGAYNKYDNTITLDSKYKSAPESVLLHEIQHAIQNIEGFSGGTNPQAWAMRDLDGSVTKRFADEYKELYAGISRENQNKYQRYKELEFAMGEILYSEKQSDQERMERYEEESDTLYAELYYQPWFLRLDTLHRLLNDTSSLYSYLYRNSAGEIEARDVAKRRDLTAEERRNRMPETGDENTVFAESDISNIIKKDKYGIPFVEITTNIIKGVPKKEIPKALAQVVKTKFNDWIDANGQKIGINNKTADEWRFSKSSEWLLQGNKKTFKDKMRAFDNADELLKASLQYIEEKAKHKNYEAYGRGKVNFRVDGRDYNADILVGIDKKSRAFLYDIVRVKRIKIEEAHTTLAESSADRRNRATSIDSITDSSEKSNTKFSIGRSKDAAYMDAVNRGDMAEAQRMVDEAAKAAGYSERLFHQTDAEFSVFDPRHKGAGSRDNETPYGIFMKKTPGDIGLKGKNQMQLYAKLKNPLVVQNRHELRKTLENMSSAYRAIRNEIENLNSDYSEKYESAKNAFRNYRIEWRKNNPDASRNDLYKDEYFQKLFDAKDNVVDEWEEEASKLDAKAKEIITNAITDAGYDGIILQEDKGSFGRSTDAYIALEPSQVKSADPVTYDDDGNIIPLSERFNEESDDIRWSIGRPTDTKAERKKQNRLDEATMREFDRLMKQRSEDERKDAEATMRMHDKLIKEVYDEAKALSAEEKREIRKNVKEEDKERMKKELAARAAKYRKERSNARKNLNEVLKEAEKQRKDYERKIAAPEKEAMRKQQEKTDRARRAERIRVAKEEYKRNAPKPAEGTTESLYFKNNNARELMAQFRRNVIGYLVEHGKFVETNGEVVLDENGMEIAYRNANDEWEISKRKNTYTPSWGLTLLAEKVGIDKDVFFTIYSKIADMRTKRNKNGTLVYKKKDVMDYIISLNLNQKQKEFLYFDAAGYAYKTMPLFLPGGRVNEKSGNTRGRMVEALDNIAIDMFAGTMNDDYFESQQIREKDINAFVDAVFGNEESQERNDFALFLAGSIIDYSAQMETVRLQERTKLLTDKPKEKNSVKMQILRAYRESKRLFVAEGEAFERMGEKLKNPLITARYYGAKKSSAIANEMIYGKTQRDLKGEKQGKSLYEIFKPVFRADEEAGNNDNMTELTELVNCRHDIYRLRNGKGYTGYSIEECEKIVDRISKENSELLKVADEIVEYGRNLLRMCVESGRISEADFDYFTAKYPYYAPTFRLRSNEYIDRKGNVVRRDTKVIRTAVGGNDDVLPLFDQFVRRTQEIVKACKKNQLASELARSFTMPQSAEYIKDVRKSEKQEDKEKEIASIGEVEDIGRARKEDGNENIIPWYSNGKKYDIEVEDTALLHGWDRITFRYNEAMIATAFRKMNNIRRGILTQYNPTFWLTNGIKDIQDMYLYNQHAQRLPKFHLEAAKTMFAGTFGKGKNEEALEEYLSFGMSQASIFEYDNTNSGRRTKRARVNEALRKPIDAFNGLNFMVEQTPRLAVYMETMDRLEKQRKNGGNTYTDEEIKTIAAYQASDATLNFGRGGTVVKAANAYGMTFLNAGVQGMDRFRRMFTQVKDGNKRAMIINICGLIMKLGIVGVGWNVLTDWIYGGDDEYAKAIREALYEDDADKIAQEYNEMADYQRTNYLLLNINGVWVRIPKGRLASFVYGFVYNGEKVYSGEMDALDLISAQMDLASETILFSNPITNNIFGPFVDVWRNKDAWDVEIVSEYEDMGEGFHYLESDEETTDLAIAIAEFGHYLTADLFGVESSRILDISPKKLDYLIEQYLGSYANVIMPFLSKEQNLKDNAIGALTEIIRKFYIDPTSSNRLAGDYYDLKEEFENIANAHEGDSPYAVASKVFGDYTEELKALRDEINAIGADTSLSRKERLEQISELREQMNELYRQGILDAKDALGFAHANYYGKDGNSDLYEDWQKTSKGADWVVTTMSDTAQEQFALVEKDGVDAENFVNAYTFINNATADKDENGKSINGSKKEKIVNYLNSLDLTAEQKMSLYTNVAGYKVSDRAPAPSFVNGALIQPSTSNMAAPIAGGGRMTSGYGWRNCPFHGREFHQAVDIAAESGTDVGAVISGTVTMATVHGEYGNSIEITSTDENGNTVVTKYNHLLNMGVEVGDVINQGTKIGEVGSTGSSTGAHLDFRLKINNDWVDPTQYIDLESSGVVDATGYTQKEGSGGSASSGGYSGRSGGSSGGSDRKASTASTPRTETKYDSVTKISGGSSGGSSYSGGGVMLPTASEIAQINSRTVSGRSTKSATYGAKGSYLPKANSTPQHNLGTSVATTQRTGRTGGSMWDENLLS